MPGHHENASRRIPWENLYEVESPGILKNKVQQEQFTRLMKGRDKINDLLDIGCGAGAFWSFLFGVHIIGIDINLSQAARKKARKFGVDLVLGDAQHLPFKNGSFDIAVEQDVLEHLECPFMALRETSRILRDDGEFLVSVPCFFDKIVLPGLMPILMPLNRLHNMLFLGGRNKQALHSKSHNRRDSGVGAKIFEMLNRCKFNYLRLTLIRMFWMFMKVDICITEHKNRYGWRWVSLIQNMGFTVENVQGAAVLYSLVSIFFPNQDLLDQQERRVRSRFPFKYMGETICFVAHKK
jgi:SAM-dependent methyltransferase